MKNITSGRIQKIVAQLHDGVDRGASEDELQFIKSYYDRVLVEYSELDFDDYRNIYSYVCFLLTKEDYFKKKPEN